MPHITLSDRALSDLQPGEKGLIRDVLGHAEIRNRLLEMGLTRGTCVELIRVAPMGDPVEFLVRGYRLSLRKAEASSVLIEAA